MKKIFALFIIHISSSVFAEWMEDPCVLFNEKGTKCIYTIDDVKLIISPDGEVIFNNTKLKVDLPEHFEIEEVRDGQISGDAVFLNLAITNHESGSTVVISMSLQKQKINWSREFPAFNSSPLLIHENELYIGGIGRVAKYSALDGKLVWELKGLYERETQAFNGFNKPVISGTIVEFPESKVSTAKYSGIRKVVVNRQTGKLLSN